jgi:predicted nucleic acid-binding protein
VTSSMKDAVFEAFVSIVLDASTALAAVLPDEGSAFARAAVAAALQEGLVVPTLWFYEIQNGLTMALRRGRIDAEAIDAALDALRALPALPETPQGLGQELRLALARNVTAYDAAYLAVAVRTGAKLATNDRVLQKAAQTIGIALFTQPPKRA